MLDYSDALHQLRLTFSTTTYQGHNYIYLTNTTHFIRYEWDGQKLTQDSSWGPVTYPASGQTGGGTTDRHERLGR